MSRLPEKKIIIGDIRLMKQTLKIEIECGAETCASESGKFCHLFRGQLNKNSCYIFGSVFYPLNDECGWVQRHPDCILMGERETCEGE